MLLKNNCMNLGKIKKEIEKKLKIKIVNLKPARKQWSSTANAFFIKALSGKNAGINYFLKINRGENIYDEINGVKFLGNILATPKIILHSKNISNHNNKWILFEYIHGNLMSEKFIASKNTKKMKKFIAYEKLKEMNLKKLHCQKTIKINYTSYIKSRTNRLFYKRLFGKKYKEFYKTNKNNIASLFDREIFINGDKSPFTINQIVNNIKKKYKNNRFKKILAIMGHGDAHHGNIIVNDKIWFIDNEYSDYIPPFMELAKPYYNDFLGTLFFHNQNCLNGYFIIKKYIDNGKKIFIDINTPKKIDNYLKITHIKLLARKNTVNENTDDFLSLNDYLILCHMLTKNPNNYPPKTKKIFLIFIIILARFNPFIPESIYKYLGKTIKP